MSSAASGRPRRRWWMSRAPSASAMAASALRAAKVWRPGTPSMAPGSKPSDFSLRCSRRTSAEVKGLAASAGSRAAGPLVAACALSATIGSRPARSATQSDAATRQTRNIDPAMRSSASARCDRVGPPRHRRPAKVRTSVLNCRAKPESGKRGPMTSPPSPGMGSKQTPSGHFGSSVVRSSRVKVEFACVACLHGRNPSK